MNFEEALKLADAAVFAKANRHLKDIEVIILRGAWQSLEYHKIAGDCGYAAEYLMQDVGPKLWKLLSEALGEKVSKRNFRSALERRSHLLQSQTAAQSIPPTIYLGVASNSLHQDWGEAPDTSMFFGRATELNTLSQWILRDRCRLVALLGMGGIGKTALAAKLGAEIQGEFEYLIWRSLRRVRASQSCLTKAFKNLHHIVIVHRSPFDFLSQATLESYLSVDRIECEPSYQSEVLRTVEGTNAGFVFIKGHI